MSIQILCTATGQKKKIVENAWTQKYKKGMDKYSRVALGQAAGLAGQGSGSCGKRHFTALRLIKADRSGGSKKREEEACLLHCKGPALLTLSREPSLAFQLSCKRFSYIKIL